VNLLYLASPLYMLQVYNRVVNSGSQTTLFLLTLILLVAFGALALVDLVRTRILARMSLRIERLLAPHLFAAGFDRQSGKNAARQPLRDLDTLRQFVTSGSTSALLDLPWVPVFLVAAFLLHPLIGWFAVVGCLLLVGTAIVSEYVVSTPLRQANDAGAKSHNFAEMSFRNGEAVTAMGMLDGVSRRWGRDRGRYIAKQAEAGAHATTVGGLVKFLRLSLQSLILGLGAWLAIEHLTSAGAMFASTFLLGRALQPIEQLVGGWRGMIAARTAYLNIADILDAVPAQDKVLSLPRPKGNLSVEAMHYGLPGNARFILRNISFALGTGDALGVVGPSGAGKSTLLRLLVGVVRPTAGTIRLDGADLRTWPRAELGGYIGYLPQDIELFADTVAANISRFAEGADAEIVKAAELAGVHELILRLPQGYNTQVGDGGLAISGGIRQRIGLARAVFGLPSLVALDEPSSNLDAEGDAALGRCIAALKQAGTTVVIVSHRPASLAGVDRILLLRDGQVEAIGPRDSVAGKLLPSRAPAQSAAGGVS
jgi:PrtD family type I secretion system ABC transporter